jgi:hypothetical protein
MSQEDSVAGEGLSPKTTVALCCGGRSPGCDLPFGPAAPAT